MSETDELRAELTKCGIEWRWEDERTTYWYVTVDGEEWGEWTAIEMGGYLHLSFSSGDVLTPAQAVAATLGSGTCHITPKFTCSECGHQYPTRNYESYETCDGRTAYAPLGHYVLDCKKPNFCPNCGRRVKEVYEC